MYIVNFENILNHKKQLLPTGETIILVEEGDKIHNDFQKFNPEKSLITNSIFWAILDIEGFPFFLGDVRGSYGPSGPAWGLGLNLYPK